MAASTQAVESPRSLLEALDLTNEEGDSLIGDVEEASAYAQRNLHRLQLHAQVKRLATILRGFKNWSESLRDFQATEQQIRVALHQEGSTVQILTQMKRAANGVANSGNNGGAIDRGLTELDRAVHELNNSFPEARPIRSDSPPPHDERRESRDFGTFDPFADDHSFSNSGIPATETMNVTEIVRVTSEDDAHIIGGNEYQNDGNVATGLPRHMRIHEWNASGRSKSILGDRHV